SLLARACSVPLFTLSSTRPHTTSVLSLHDALPISPPPPGRSGSWPEQRRRPGRRQHAPRAGGCRSRPRNGRPPCRRYAPPPPGGDRKSTRLNSSHVSISYAVFCLKKKKINSDNYRR